tara:strand:+ start:21337 stop:22095 length:759 start_codon:yes stop_codon:yes gene_type:complete
MTRIYSILVLLLITLLGCNSENAPDCFQNAGEIIQEEIDLESFSKITVFEGIKIVLKQGNEQKITLETGEFLRNDITIDVVGERLILRNENSCNLVRDFGLTTVYITAPNISEIRSSTGFPIKSDGVLNYPSLSLLAESFGEPEAETTDGEFDIEINNTNLRIVSNGIAYFNIKGNTKEFNIIIAAGDSRIDAKNLIAENIVLSHRGSNDILINPRQSLKATLTGTGDVISFNQPPIVEVEELYNGKLIFNN